MLKALHTADLHFTNKTDKLAEVVRTTDFILECAGIEQPDVAFVAGDLVDEHDGRIMADSDAARAAIRFVTELGSICPVVIVRGTRSHDRETPYLFAHLRANFPIYVATEIEQVALLEDNRFIPLNDETPLQECKAVFTLIPSPDKANLLAVFGSDSISSCTIAAKETLSDGLAYLGEVNAQIPEFIPRIMVSHGMITGAEFSSGTTTTGEDFEFGVSDLNMTNTDLKAFGHIHKMQAFPGNIFYSGSPGRLNMGELETKGFLIHTLDGQCLAETRFIETPARRFVLYDVPWQEVENRDGIDNILEKVAECEVECDGAEVRFRYTIPEERRHQINREKLISRFLDAGARLAKIEPTLIPMVRQRAAGISQMSGLRPKIEKWGIVANIVIPERVLTISDTIESRSVEELIEDAKRAIAARMAVGDLYVEVKQLEQESIAVHEEEQVAADQYHDAPGQFDLFG
jgi:DNA repair exonuclease SbcCD nuclease subunit